LPRKLVLTTTPTTLASALLRLLRLLAHSIALKSVALENQGVGTLKEKGRLVPTPLFSWEEGSASL